MPGSSRIDLVRLAADALVSGTPDAHLLLEYWRDPEALAEEEQREVEEYLAASPAHRDQLRVLVALAMTSRRAENASEATGLTPLRSTSRSEETERLSLVQYGERPTRILPAQIPTGVAVAVGAALCALGFVIGYWLG